MVLALHYIAVSLCCFVLGWRVPLAF